MAGEHIKGIIQSAADKLSNLLPSPSVTSSSSATGDADLKDLKRLERTMNRIQTLLIEADNRDIRDISEKHRLKELKEVALDAEDLVEDYAYEVTHAKLQIRNTMITKGKIKEDITDLSSIVVSVAIPEEMGMRVTAIKKRFDEIVKEWESLRWMESDGRRRLGLDKARKTPSGSMVHEPFIHGRNHDKEMIIETLLKEDVNNGKNGGNLWVLPIVGMGGIGKTTLAQLVYNDPRVNQHFDLKCWVWVWENFDVTTLTENIITSLTKKPCDLTHLDALQFNLQEILKGKKLLLVLDDVWNEEGSLWDSLRALLFNSSFSKVIVTTRNEKVAKVMQTIPFYPLYCLGTEDSWKLFKQVVFENREQREDGILVEIGRKITIKCGGLPLAVKAIGCALRFELDEEVWGDILESELWELEAGKNEVLPALQLSYNCMPMHLKQCFMFLSLFPKDFVFVKDKIIKLWASLGFFQSKSKKSIKNNIGSVYFDDLQQRSMVQKVQYDEKYCNYVVHDLMHKLAEIEGGELFARVEVLNSFSSKVVRYLTVVVNDLPKTIDLIPIQQLNSLRVLQVLNNVNKWMSKDIGINFHRGFFENLKCLRALDFSYTGITSLPDSIGDLKQLRYLGLTETNIKHLPDTICLLYNLQTVDLLGCPLQMLPRGINNLVMLQHLNIAKWSSVPTPHGIGHLTNLVTLPAFNLNEHSRCQISELRNLKYIQGELCITGLDNVRDIYEVILADMESKKQINCLTLDWSSNASKTENHPFAGVVMEVLKPHENLQELEIYRYPGLYYPRWLGDISYRRLVQIVLFGNRQIGCTFLPSLGRLPVLRNLSIQCMLNVICVGHEFCGCNEKIKGFSSINSLEFKYMPRWVQWFGIENGEFCSLNSLKIVRCDALRFMPFQLSSSLTKLVLNHCKVLINLPILPSLTSLILMGRLNKYFFVNLVSPSLKSLELGFSQNIRVISLNFLDLKSLEVLVIKGCKNLESIVGLYNFTSLKELELDGCPCLKLSENQMFPPLLQVLEITNCPQLDKQVNFGHKKIDNAINEEWLAHEYDDISHEYEDISQNEEPPWNDLWGDSNDYKLETWLSSPISQSQQSKDQPTTSRKRDRDDILKESQNSFDRGKQIMGYSSGSSFGGNSGSELGSYGNTSEEEFCL